MKHLFNYFITVLIIMTIVMMSTVVLMFTIVPHKVEVEELYLGHYRFLYNDEMNKKLKDYYKERLKVEFYKDHIPEEYADAFIYHTKDFPEIRQHFYSLMVFESDNFKYFVSKRNKNGSIDYGPSQLNSYNIKDKWFMNKFGPKDKTYINTTYCYYMVTCINLYKSLCDEHGEKYAFFGYNGGQRAIRLIKSNIIRGPKNRSLVKAVTEYDIGVRRAIKNSIIKFEKYKELRKLDMIVSAMSIKINKDYKTNNTLVKKIIGFDKLSHYCIIGKIKRKYLIELKLEERIDTINSIIRNFNV